MAPLDWQTGKTHLECSRYMLDNQVNCDVNFKVGENEENIKAHKYVLSMRSAVFDRMFNGSFCEAEKDPVIPDVTPAAFKMMLGYCYYECLDMEDDVALSVLYTATKYMLPLLEEAARTKLIRILSSSNVWDIYKYAINVGDAKLLNRCQMFFQGNITPVKEALQTEAFLNIPHKVLIQLLHINDQVEGESSLNQNSGDILTGSNIEWSRTNKAVSVYYKNHIGISISDIELFKACNTWAEAECLQQEIEPTGANKRTVLGECVSLIRFPTMLQENLATIVYPTGILTQEEIVNIGLYIYQLPGSDCQADFPSKERQFVVMSPDLDDCFPDISTVHTEPEVRVMLSTVWIITPGSYRITVKDETSKGSWSMNYDSTFQGHATNLIESNTRILHYISIKPQLLEAGTKYSITAERTQGFPHPDPKLVTKWSKIKDLCPFKEVQITRNLTEDNSIYALTLCLV